MSWFTGDAVYMRSETKRKEYVLSQYGQIYKGTYRKIKGTPWNYGQVPKTSILGSVMVVCFVCLCYFALLSLRASAV